MIGWDDAPHLNPPHISKEELDDLERDMLPHQRQARRTGRPALGAGAIYPVDEDTIFIDPIPIPDHWERAWAMDVGWTRTAALIGARDPDTDIYYLTGEYYLGQQMPIVHAHAIKAMLPWKTLEGAIDPAAKGSNQKDGTKLRTEYEDLGLRLRSANNAVSAGIHRTLILMQGGQLKVFNTLTNWRKEFRLYRRVTKKTERGETSAIVKENDHLMDCTRYLVNTPDLFTTRPVDRARRRRSGEW
jgi:hypothetical protein